MKTYTSIPKWKPEYFGKHVFGFDKIDGSNFRAEWDRKLSKKSRFTKGFSKFGTRNQAIHKNSQFFEGVKIFDEKFSEGLDELFRTEKRFRGIDRITVYGEFFGDNSFAGIHDWNEPHDIFLYDVFLYKKGYLPPREFKDVFQENFDCCIQFWNGLFNEEIVKKVESNTMNRKFKLEEGMVFKGVEEGKVFMFKIKTDEWLQKVKEKYGEAKMLEY